MLQLQVPSQPFTPGITASCHGPHLTHTTDQKVLPSHLTLCLCCLLGPLTHTRLAKNWVRLPSLAPPMRSRTQETLYEYCMGGR